MKFPRRVLASLAATGVAAAGLVTAAPSASALTPIEADFLIAVINNTSCEYLRADARNVGYETRSDVVAGAKAALRNNGHASETSLANRVSNTVADRYVKCGAVKGGGSSFGLSS